mmetsp:Transcript_75112/g.123952  ORF Transcript_75112/g.123952 Transcript_75112/m.123952 type:complete len:663 (+) Transcript_75112:50-2038(+)
MIFSILLSACAVSVWGTPCATEDCEDLELLTVKSQKAELERPRGRGPFHRDEDDLRYLVFPVQGDYAWNIINRKRHKVTLSARGGGTRAMAGTIGQLRALKDMNLLGEVDQILANSGSTWSTAVYLFADKSYSSEDLLGASTFGKLANLTLDAIKIPNGELIKSANASFDTYLTAAFAAAAGGLVNFSNAFEAAVGGAYFCRFGLNGELPQWPFPFQAFLCNNANKNQIYVESERQLKTIKFRNPKLNVSNALIKQRTNVSSYVMLACMLSPVGYEPIGDSIVSVRFSPDFSGFPYFADEKAVTFKPLNTSLFGSLPTLENVLVGGGVVESFAFMGVEEPEREPRIVRPYRASSAALDVGPVSLQQASAYSSSIFSILGLTSPETLDNLTFNQLTSVLQADPFLVTPRRPTWPVALEKQGDDKRRDFYLGDAGFLDNGGLPEAIRSGAKCSILLLNNIRPIDTTVVGDWCNVPDVVKQNPLALLGPPALGFPERDAALYDYFGIFLQLGDATLKTIGFDFTNNQLFETHLIYDLFCEATNLTAQGKPAVVHKTYTTIENKHWGIKAGTEVDVLFVFQQISQDWLEQLDPATKQAILNGDFNTKGSVNGVPWRFSFPHLSTISPQGEGAESTAIAIEQANLYASLAEYSLRVNEPKLRQCMGL